MIAFLLIISTLICFGFIVYVGIVYRVASISASYYKLEDERSGLGKIFTLWAILSSLTILPCWLMVTGGYWNLIVYAGVISLIAVGFCPDFKVKNKVSHPILNAICSVLACIWCLINGTIYIPLALMLISTITCLVINHWKFTLHDLASVKTLYWVEASAFIGVYASIWMKMYAL